jgi:CheY-like chemotaxis protein
MTKVLVVDDSAVDRLLVGNILEKEGYAVTFASDGQQALSILAEHRFDVVVSDLQMPIVDGLQLVSQIRSEFPHTPVILVTGQGSEEIAASALRCGAASYVPKRTIQSDLVSTIQTVLSATIPESECESLRGILVESVSHYVIGYEPEAPKALISHLQRCLNLTCINSETEKIRIATALAEALANAIDHGNLELDSNLREENISLYDQTGRERSQVEPYCRRRVYVTAKLEPNRATFIIRDDGPGFQPDALPDPTDPENLCKPCGRGVLLIRTFMDEVTFNPLGNEITMVKYF